MSAAVPLVMRRLSLVRGPTVWRIDGTALALQRFGRDWRIVIYTSEESEMVQTNAWMVANGLDDATFCTRAEAFRCAAATIAAADPPPPATVDPVVLRRVASGHYVSGDRFDVRGTSGPIWGWAIEDRLNPAVFLPARTLSEAAQLIADRSRSSGRPERRRAAGDRPRTARSDWRRLAR
jgi:hypothetical protein